MKRLFIIGLATLLAAGSVFAQAELVKQRAEQIRDNNNRQQGIVPNNQPAPVAHAPAAPSAPQGLSAAQQALIDKVQADFTAIKTGVPASELQKTAMQNNLLNLAKGVNKPTLAQVARLGNDLATALAEKNLSAVEIAQMSKAINIVMNCFALSAARAQTFVATAQTALKNAGVSEASVQAVGSDLKAIVNEIQKSKPSLYQ